VLVVATLLKKYKVKKLQMMRQTQSPAVQTIPTG
jgi:hypothetical protein